MKQTYFLISMLLLVATLFLSNSFAQDYVNYETLKGHTDEIWRLVFSPDGRMLASGSWDGTIRLWDVATGYHRTISGALFPGVVGEVNFAFSPDGQTLATGLTITHKFWVIVL